MNIKVLDNTHSSAAKSVPRHTTQQILRQDSMSRMFFVERIMRLCSFFNSYAALADVIAAWGKNLTTQKLLKNLNYLDAMEVY
jgi:hypothetical protein